MIHQQSYLDFSINLMGCHGAELFPKLCLSAPQGSIFLLLQGPLLPVSFYLVYERWNMAEWRRKHSWCFKELFSDDCSVFFVELSGMFYLPDTFRSGHCCLKSRVSFSKHLQNLKCAPLDFSILKKSLEFTYLKENDLKYILPLTKVNES